MNPRVQKMTFLSMMLALALVLEIVSSLFFRMPEGGSFSLVAIPIWLVGLRYHWRSAVFVGVATGVLQGLFIPPYIVHPIQYLLDYGVAFGVLGFGAVFAKQATSSTRQLTALVLGVLLVLVVRYLVHVTTGIFYFPEYAGDQIVWMYSLGYNATYMAPYALATLLVTPPVWWALHSKTSLLK
jgi:thiamine transporter